MKKFYTLSFIFLVSSLAMGQVVPQSQPFWIFLEDNPARCIVSPALGEKALLRRQRAAIPLQPSDYPVAQADIQRIQTLGYHVLGASRYLNAVAVQKTNEAKPLPEDFVLYTTPMRSTSWAEESTESYAYGSGLTAIQQLNGVPLHDAFYDAAGMHIAVMDAGFSGVPALGAFASLFAQNRIVTTKDFTDGDTNVFESSTHGTSVLSTMCSDLNGLFVGTAPKATFSLFKTEIVASETPLEELHWVRAAEWADSLGADLMNTSLGYSVFDNPLDNHSYADMNGRTTPISRAAVKAAQAGILVCVSAGNEGSSSWRHITAPADADSVLTVGAVNPMGVRTPFSSQGPSSDARIKPDLMALGGQAGIVNGAGDIVTGNGTSFSSPILCGMTACLMQKHPTRTAQDILSVLRLTASQGFSPDTLMGWGIPNFGMADTFIGQKEYGAPGVSFWFSAEGLNGKWDDEFSGKATLSVLDLAGRVLFFQENVFVENGRFVHSLSLPSGPVVVRVRVGSALYGARLMR